jgi:hypothetical protein
MIVDRHRLEKTVAIHDQRAEPICTSEIQLLSDLSGPDSHCVSPAPSY